MTFPSPGTPVETSFPTATTDHNVGLPPIVNAGDLLFMNFGVYLDDPLTKPTGWTELWNIVPSGSTVHRGAGYAKVADGTEGGGTANVVSSTAAAAAAQVIRVTGWYGSLAGVEVAADGPVSGSQIDPPSLSPSWGARDSLWIACGSAGDDDATVVSYPTNYTGGTDTVSGAGANLGAECFSAVRQLNAATENPGVFTLSQSESRVAATIAVRPAAVWIPPARRPVLRQPLIGF